VKFAQATPSVNSISSQVESNASKMGKAAKKTPQTVSITPKKKSALNEPEKISSDSDDDGFESSAPVIYFLN
jgi:hypothetical protein